MIETSKYRITVTQNLLKFEEDQLNPEPCNKQKHHHLRKSETKPRSKAKTWALGIETETQSRKQTR